MRRIVVIGAVFAGILAGFASGVVVMRMQIRDTANNNIEVEYGALRDMAEISTTQRALPTDTPGSIAPRDAADKVFRGMDEDCQYGTAWPSTDSKRDFRRCLPDFGIDPSEARRYVERYEENWDSTYRGRKFVVDAISRFRLAQ